MAAKVIFLVYGLFPKRKAYNVANMVTMIHQSSIPQALRRVCETIRDSGGKAWLVGGSVRDLILDIMPHDWDIEVYGLEPDALWTVLKAMGHCEHVGKKFGVSKLWFEGLEIDVALPRTEVKTASGHKGFSVISDAYILPEKSSLRRDFTINAMMFEPLEGEFLDFHDGIKHLKEKRLRHVSPAFAEDPLRPLRAMQFAARFQLTLDTETQQLCQTLLAEAESLPSSRVWQEWLKWSKAAYPSYGLQALQSMGWLKLYPELESLLACPQSQRWHPEGDVWVHTCLVADQAARLKQMRDLTEKEQFVLMFAALCHDFGKPMATFKDESGQIVSPEHEKTGVRPARAFLQRIAAPKFVIKMVMPLIKEHVAHFSEEASAQQIAQLAQRLEPANIQLWEVLTEADASGCPPLLESRPALAWLKKAKFMGVLRGKSAPIMTGKLLIKWGVEPSPCMGKVIAFAYRAQLKGDIFDEASAYHWFQKYDIASDDE